MEVINRYSIRSCKYRVLKGFYGRPAGEKETRLLGTDEVVTFDEKTPSIFIIEMAHLGRLIINDLPQIARYQALRNLDHRVGGQRLEIVKAGEIFEMVAAEAWPLLIGRKIKPIDPNAWAPDRLDPKNVKKR